MSDTISRDEAIDRMKAGLSCETYSLGLNDWRPTEWADFDSRADPMFRKPPEPRRVARDYWIYNGDVFMHKVHPDAIYAREVLPGDVVLRKMSEQEWLNLHAQAFGSACMPSALVDFARALGLIGEGS